MTRSRLKPEVLTPVASTTELPCAVKFSQRALRLILTPANPVTELAFVKSESCVTPLKSEKVLLLLPIFLPAILTLYSRWKSQNEMQKDYSFPIFKTFSSNRFASNTPPPPMTRPIQKQSSKAVKTNPGN